MNEQVMPQARGVDPLLLRRGMAILVLVAAVALGDWLFWGHTPGASIVAFLAGVGLLHLVLNWNRTQPTHAAIGLVVFLFALIPPLESSDLLNWFIGVAGTFLACMIFRGGWPKDWSERIDMYVSGGIAAIGRFPLFVWTSVKAGESGKTGRYLVGWVVPVLFALIFVMLFQQANPVWEQWLAALDFEAVLAIIFSGRVIFWLALAWFAWPFLESRLPKNKLFSGVIKAFKIPETEMGPKIKAPDTAFFERCLLLFNVVFAIQTLLDVAYLWSGAALPEGMTYAGYAHRGAYPLVGAALLAGLFVVITMRPGGPGERSQVVKWLVLLWVAQNVMLVSSSLLRLDLYVDVFGLTYWRIAAFIWMGLVALGLVLIVLRFLTGKSTGWLISANVFSLCAVLYATSMTNLPGIIASHNLQVERFYSKAQPIDWRYLRWLGAAAYPAALAAQEALEKDPQLPHVIYRIRRYNKVLARKVRRAHDRNWRAWSFRDHRAYWAYQGMQNRLIEKRRNEREITAP